MIKIKLLLLCCSLAGAGLLSPWGAAQAQDDNARAAAGDPSSATVEQLRDRLSQLQTRAQRVRDANDIKRLQRAFGYYLDEALWDEVVDLFAEDATLEWARDGVYQGRERIRAYFQQLGEGRVGLSEGQLNEHYQLMPVVTLGEDGKTAKARWRTIILKGEYQDHAWWGEGPYENEYVKEDGVWKISKLHWFETIMVPYEGGWASNPSVTNGLYVSEELPPDAPSTYDFGAWPETFLPPFHFDNPVKTYLPEGGQQ